MAGLVDQIYQKSPVWIQNAGVALWGWWWFKRRFGEHFHRAVEEIEARDRFSRARWQSWQEERLGILLETARRAPHYRRVFEQHGIARGMSPFEALAKMPLLTKQTLRVSGRELLTETPGRDVSVFRSSGTTGTPTEIFFSRAFHQLVQAYFEVRIRHWAGVDYRSRRAMFGVRKVCRHDQERPPFWRHSPAENLAYCSIYHLSPRFMPAYVEFLREFQPSVIMGYPNSLATLARFILATKSKVPAPKVVITTSETLTDEMRAALEAAFGCVVRDNYCAVEACVLASQCEHGGYHLSPDFGVFEIVDREGRPCPKGQIGRAVCTGLNNTIQPLIRYEIGDAVAWAEEQSCPCGREMPLIRSIEGRFEDMCYTADGREVLRFDTVFKGISSIQEAQVVQEALDHFVIKVVPTAEFDDRDRSRLVSNMKLHVGPVRTEVVSVSEIPRTSGGKFKPVISRVSRPSEISKESRK